MTPPEFLSAIRKEADRMAGLDIELFGARVPSCPDWDVADLMSHTGWVHRWMRYTLSLAEGERATKESLIAAGLPRIGSSQRPDGDLVPWFRDGVDSLLAAFEETPPSRTMNTVFGTHPPSLLMRRMAHETAMHRWDAEHALGTPDGFDAELAADGIEELLELWVPKTFRYAEFEGSGSTIHLCSADGGIGWVVSVRPGTTEWSRGHGEGADVTARGDVSDLYLFVWNRCRVDQLDVVGDRDLLTRWQAAATV